MLELKAEFQLQPIDFNFEALKAALAEKLDTYQGLIVSEDGIQAAKDDRAMLNKLSKEIDSRRISIKKDFMKPYDEFEKKAKELVAMIEKPVSAIDKQIKAFEDAAKEKKRSELEAHYQSVIESPAMAALLPFERILKTSWLNASVKIKAAMQELTEVVTAHHNNIHLIRDMQLVFEQEVLRVYLDTLDMSAALRKKVQLEEQARLMEELKAKEQARLTEIVPAPEPVQIIETEPDIPVIHITREEAPEPSIMDIMREIDPRRNVIFRTWITPEDHAMIEQFLKSKGIDYELQYA